MRSIRLSDRSVSTVLPALVMGIVNATPDSFFGGRGGIDEALRMIDEGADVLDVGGESTRPGSEYVDADEEIRRVIPVIREIRRHSDIPVSVDTRKFEVMRAAFDEGADILNDVSALEDDERLASFCAGTRIPVILMHKRGIPSVMQRNTAYDDVFEEVSSYLSSRADYAKSFGIEDDKIWVDAGIGFGKSGADSFELMRRCSELCGGRYPVLMALSRKSCIGEVTGGAVDERLAGTISANLLAVERGAAMIRVHDVREAADSLRILSAFCR